MATQAIDQPWLTGSKYMALVSVGALVPGWSLISPIAHARNMSSSFDDPEFWLFALKAENILRNRYGKICVFEHGAQFSGSQTGCGTDHAHLHMVPLEFSLSQEAIRFDPALVWKRCPISEVAILASEREYLFVADDFRGKESIGLLCILDTPVSQYFRKVIATRNGMSDFYNYRHFPMLEIAVSSAAQLHADVTAASS
jgi:ATP adenylyltransferase